MNQSNQINNISEISASFRDGDHKTDAHTSKVAMANDNACQVSFGDQDPI